ncbi:MAG: hypothetical protein WBM68_03150, partial [Woeseia sp.]
MPFTLRRRRRMRLQTRFLRVISAAAEFFLAGGMFRAANDKKNGVLVLAPRSAIDDYQNARGRGARAVFEPAFWCCSTLHTPNFTRQSERAYTKKITKN